MDLLPWARRYIGIPYVNKGRSIDGADCWGIVRLILKEQLNVEVPSYSDLYKNADDVKAWAKAINEHKHSIFEKVPFSVERFNNTGAVVFMYVGNLPLHVGYFIGTEYGHRYVIHSEEDRMSSYRASLENTDALAGTQPTFYLPKGF